MLSKVHPDPNPGKKIEVDLDPNPGRGSKWIRPNVVDPDPQRWFSPTSFLVSRRWSEFVDFSPLRVAVGTYNINGGKHFRSVVYQVNGEVFWLVGALLTLV